MPAAALASLAPAIAGLVGQGANAASNSANNAAQRRYNERMYARQRMDSDYDWMRQNAYNEDMWNMNNQYNEEMWEKQRQWDIEKWKMENEYNSPANQAARLKEAGINLHAAYGGINGGGAAIDASQLVKASAPQSSARDSTSPMSYNPRAAQFDFQSGVMAAVDVRVREAQIDLLKAQRETMIQDGLLKTEKTLGESIRNESDGYRRNILRDSWNDSVDAIGENVRKMKIENDFATTLQGYRTNQERRSQEQHDQSYAYNYNRETRDQQRHEGAMSMLAQQISNAARDGQLKLSVLEAKELENIIKKYEVILNTVGMQKNDNTLSRLFGTWWNKEVFKNGESIKDAYNRLIK